MTTQTGSRKRGVTISLAVLGGLLIAGGAITAMVAGSKINDAQLNDGFAKIYGLPHDTVAPLWIAIWVGVGIAVFGVLILIGVAFMFASREKAVEPSVSGRLDELAKLHDAGHITDDEYQAKRTDIVGTV